VINEKLYVQKGKKIVLWQVVEGVVVEWEKKTSAIYIYFPFTFIGQTYD
jgi:hypothetical protein